jgi:hypothetical protein
MSLARVAEMGVHVRIAGDKPLLRIAIGAMCHLRHDGVIEHDPDRVMVVDRSGIHRSQRDPSGAQA